MRALHMRGQLRDGGKGKKMTAHNGLCDACCGEAAPLLSVPMVALCFGCWDGKETPLETVERLNFKVKDEEDWEIAW